MRLTPERSITRTRPAHFGISPSTMDRSRGDESMVRSPVATTAGFGRERSIRTVASLARTEVSSGLDPIFKRTSMFLNRPLKRPTSRSNHGAVGTEQAPKGFAGKIKIVGRISRAQSPVFFTGDKRSKRQTGPAKKPSRRQSLTSDGTCMPYGGKQSLPDARSTGGNLRGMHSRYHPTALLEAVLSVSSHFPRR